MSTYIEGVGWVGAPRIDQMPAEGKNDFLRRGSNRGGVPGNRYRNREATERRIAQEEAKIARREELARRRATASLSYRAERTSVAAARRIAGTGRRSTTRGLERRDNPIAQQQRIRAWWDEGR